MTRPKKIIVIGGTAAGPAAAAKAKRVNPDANVMMFEAGGYISSGTCEIPYVLSGEIKNYKDLLLYDPASFREKKGVNVYIRHRVEDINRKDKEIRVLDLYNGTTHYYSYDKLIITTGAKPRSLENFSVPANNLFKLKSIGDLVSILEYTKRKVVRNVIVVGSGYIGLETADAMSTRGFNITVLEKEKHPLPVSEPEIQTMIEKLLSKKSIRFLGGVNDLKPNYSNEVIESIATGGRVIETDMIIFAAGFIPDTELAIKSGLEIGEYGGIKVDLTLKTSDSHIYAAGDCIEVINEITYRPFYLPLATISHNYAHVAGENAAGNNKRVKSVVKNISVKLWDRYYISVGLSSIDAEKYEFKYKSESESTNNLVKIMPGSENVFGKIIYEAYTKRILGASFFGGKEVSGYGDLISALIRAKQSARFLSEINYNYTPPLSPYINLLSLLGRKIK